MIENSKFIPISSGQNSKFKKSITLLELLIAVSILTLLILVGGGIYISGWNMFREAQFLAQSHRNAVIPMAHIVKNLQGARNFSNSNTRVLSFIEYTDITTRANATRRYIFQSANRRIVYDPDTVDNSGNEEVIGTRISNAQFRVSANLTANIFIRATDTRNHNPYEITTYVEARAGGEPPL